jgi:arabinose-5-phosphate isomerase
VIIEISQKRLGATAVTKNNKLEGIITDGDLRRMLEAGDSFSALSAKNIMSFNPIKVTVNSLAYDALQIMEGNNINQIIVVDKDMYVGIVHIHEILKEGIL